MTVIQKLHEKYPFLDSRVPAPEDTELEGVKEEFEEKIVYKPPFQGRLAEGEQKIALQAYLQEYRVGLGIIPFSPIYKRLRAERIIIPTCKTTSQIELRDVHKARAYHPNLKGHTQKSV